MFKLNNCQANRRLNNRRQIVQRHVDENEHIVNGLICELETEVHIVSREQLDNEMNLALEMVKSSIEGDHERSRAIDSFLLFHQAH